MIAFATRFSADERGATALEYGLLLALISVIVVTAITSVSSGTASIFNKVGNTLQNAGNSGS